MRVAAMTRAGHAYSAKDVFDLVEDVSVLGFARLGLELLRRERPGELFENLPLLACELARRDRLHGNEEISAPAARHIFHALAAQTKHRPGGGALRNLHRFAHVSAVNR